MGGLAKGPPAGSGRRRTYRPGVCHRCGWSGPVSRVTRADRRRLKTGRAFGRVCDECIDTLLGREQADAAASQLQKPRLVHRRDVA